MKVTTGKPGARIRKRPPSAFEPDELLAFRVRKQIPFSFVLEELSPLGVTAKSMFGFFYVYLEERLIMLLRDRENQPERNGVWLATTSEHLRSLSEEFPLLPRICVIDTGRNGWVFLPAKHPVFESYAFKACELIACGDRRIGGSSDSARARAKAFVDAGGKAAVAGKKVKDRKDTTSPVAQVDLQDRRTGS